MRTCNTCHVSKPLDEFGTYKRYADGKHRTCRVCWNARLRRNRHANGAKPMVPFLNRLWDNIQQCGHEDVCPYCCWPWLKHRDKDGYGRISISFNGRHSEYPVPRVIFELWNAMQLPDDYCACHYCDVPACCNPMHLWAGSRIANRLDCVKKGRQAQGIHNGHYTQPQAFPHGEQHHKAKLTREQVHEIRHAHRSGVSANRLGFLYSVSKQNILSILRYQTWKDV